jgi:hypothetical protein
MELFVDDGGTAADDFEGMMGKLRLIFGRFREEGMSLSATKTKLFMTEAVFAGATVGPNGVAPDAAKLEAAGDRAQLARILRPHLVFPGPRRELRQTRTAVARPLENGEHPGGR